MKGKPKTIEEKKLEIDSAKPLPATIKKSIDDFFKVEVAHTFAALDGNTLTRIESLLAIEQGMTTKGKTISEHLEVINTANAYDFIRRTAEIGPKMPFLPLLIQIFNILVDKLNEDQKGRFRSIPVRLKGITYEAPESSEVQSLLEDLATKVATLTDAKAPYLAALVHGEIIRISPFQIANERVARLVAVYLLLERGYAPVIIPLSKRQDYLESLETLLTSGKNELHNKIMVSACEKGIDEYLKFIKSDGMTVRPAKLMKIGELARATGETIATIRHYAMQSLLTIKEHTPGGYMLFSETMVERVREIRGMQRRGLSLSEIKNTK